jgi:hypothetical protein
MDKIDIISFLGTSAAVSWLTGISGYELVGLQVVWLGTLWVGKRIIDRIVGA